MNIFNKFSFNFLDNYYIDIYNDVLENCNNNYNILFINHNYFNPLNHFSHIIKKYTRIYILLKISYQEIYRLVKPINIIDKNLFNSEAKIDDQDVKIAFLVFLSFIISIFILSTVLTFDYLNYSNHLLAMFFRI